MAACNDAPAGSYRTGARPIPSRQLPGYEPSCRTSERDPVALVESCHRA